MMKKIMAVVALFVSAAFAFGDEITGNGFWVYYNFSLMYSHTSDQYYADGMYGTPSYFAEFTKEGSLIQYNLDDERNVDRSTYSAEKYSVEKHGQYTVLKTGRNGNKSLLINIVDGIFMQIPSEKYSNYDISDLEMKAEYYIFYVSEEADKGISKKDLGR